MKLFMVLRGGQRQDELLNLLRDKHLQDKQLREPTIELRPYNKE